MFPAFNTITTPSVDLPAAIDLAQRHDFQALGLWVDKVEACGATEAAQRLRDAGLRVSTLCPSGSFSDAGPAGLAAAIDRTRRTLDLAATVRAECLVLLVGTFHRHARDTEAAVERARQGLQTVLAHARSLGVSIALEPLHPMYRAEWNLINTLGEANDWTEVLGPGLGVLVDSYHVWWDRQLEVELRRAGREGRILGFHINDWRVPTRTWHTDRELPGRGVIDLPQMIGWLQDAGYDRWAEVEVFSEDYAREAPDKVWAAARESLRALGI